MELGSWNESYLDHSILLYTEKVVFSNKRLQLLFWKIESRLI